MSGIVERALLEPDRERIRRAVAKAERRTSAEIVVCVVARSDDYVEAGWRAGVWLALFVSLLAPLSSALDPLFTGLGLRDGGSASVGFEWDPQWGSGSIRFSLSILAAVALGVALARWVPWVSRRFVPERDRWRRVQQRAREAFLMEEVFATRQRGGVLLFVSLFERIVCVLPDRTVRERVPEGDWLAITERVAADIAAGGLGESLSRGVEESGRLLASHGLVRKDDDRNELDDRVRDEGC